MVYLSTQCPTPAESSPVISSVDTATPEVPTDARNADVMILAT